MKYQSGSRLEQLSSFVQVVEAGGFTAAARKTGQTKATLSRRVQELEARLRIALLVRTTRSIRLTEEGRAYFLHAARAVEAARDADEAVERSRRAPTGTLRLSTTAGLAGLLLEKVILAYLRAYPEVSIDLDLSPRNVDLVRDGFDLAIRVGEQQDSTLVARRLGMGRGGFYASPAYLRRRGDPQNPRELSAHDLLGIPRDRGPIEWPFVVAGKRINLVVRPRLRTSSFELAVAAAVGGAGIVMAPEFFVREQLKRRRLVPVLVEWTQPGVPIFAVTPPGGLSAPKVRTFVDLLAAHFAE